MDFDDLQALLWAHEHGSLQGAARATGVARTTLRRRLERLDAAIGRTTHITGPEGIRLTPAGHALVDEGRALLDARAHLLDRARGARTPQDTLRILIQAGLPPRAVASAVGLGEPLLPDVHIHIDVDPDPASRRDDGFDAIVHWGEGPVVRTGFTRTLLRASFGVMAAPNYLDRHGAPQTPADLREHTLLHLAGTEPQWPCLDGTSVQIDPSHTCSDLYILGMMVGQGLGLGLLPISGPMLDDAIDALVPVLPGHIRTERSLRLDMPVPSGPNSAAAVLIDVAKQFGQPLHDVDVEV